MSCCNKKPKKKDNSCCDRQDIVSCCKKKNSPKKNGDEIRRRAYMYLKQHNLLECAQGFTLPPKNSRRKEAMELEEKLKILDMLKEGKNIPCVAITFKISHCTVKSIKRKEKEIRARAMELGLNDRGSCGKGARWGNLQTDWSPTYTGCKTGCTINCHSPT